MQSSFKLGGDLQVRRLGFGAMRICGKGAWHWPKDRQRVGKVLARVAELGINFIDTADAYGPETSEYLLQEHLHPYQGLVIATKGGLERESARSWTTNGHPAHLQIACANSLRRLEVERIDLYQLHAIDDDVPLEDSIGALKDMQDKGWIRHIGVSNFNVEELQRARQIATIASVQNRYNLADRQHEAVVDYCQQNNIAFIPWYPLATGELCRDERLTSLAKKHKATSGQLALAWLLHRSPVMLPIPGTASVAHLEQNLGAEKLMLSDEDMSILGALA